MTLHDLFAELLNVIDETPSDQVAAVITQLAAAQSAAAARLLNGHQHGAMERSTALAAETDPLLTIAQVAHRLNVPKSYAYELVRQQKLPAVRFGKYVRVTQETLAKYIMTAASSSP